MPRTHLPAVTLVTTLVTALATALAAATLLAPAPSYAAITATFANPAPVQGVAAVGYGHNDSPITLGEAGTPAGSPYPSSVTISDVPGGITYLGVSFRLTHGYPDDVDVLLEAPSGKTVVLMSDVGGTTDVSNLWLDFDTNATTSLPDAGPLVAGTYAATNVAGNDAASETWPAPAPVPVDAQAPLTSLLGESPNGDWKLFVRDDQNQDGGQISSWNLGLYTDAVPTPAATYPSNVHVSGLAGTVADVDLHLYNLSWDHYDTLDMMLVGPGGQRAIVLSDVGTNFSIFNIGHIVVDDEAEEPMPVLTLMGNGTYRPTNAEPGDVFPPPAPDAAGAGSALSVFDGTNPNGDWHLYVVNDVAGHGLAGELAGGWALTITTADPSAPAADTVAPRVDKTAPRARAHGVRRGVNVTAHADEALDPSTVTSGTAFLVAAGSTRHVRAKVTYRPATQSVVIDPKRALRAETRYRVVITTFVRDLAGNRLDQLAAKTGRQRLTWRFTTR